MRKVLVTPSWSCAASSVMELLIPFWPRHLASRFYGRGIVDTSIPRARRGGCPFAVRGRSYSGG